MVQEVTELQQELRRKEAELIKAGETIRREQQQMRKQVYTCKEAPLGFFLPFIMYLEGLTAHTYRENSVVLCELWSLRLQETKKLHF